MLLLAAALAGGCTSDGTQDGARVMVLGIDGGTWTEIEPMMERGELPNLARLYKEGLHGILESRPPILSPVVWTTIFTGFGHKTHGVQDWKTSQSIHRRVNAIWEILREKDMKTHVFNVPSTFPPDPVKGVMLSGFPLSGSTFSGNTGEVFTEQALLEPKVSVAYRDNAEAILANVKKLEPGAWSPWFQAKVKSRPNYAGVMRVKRLDADKFYVSPLYRTDEGIIMSHPKELRAQVSEKLGEPYIPEGPGWSRWNQPDTAEYLYEHLVQVFDIQARAATLYAGDDWKLFAFIMTLVDRVSHPYWAYGHAEDYEGMDPQRAKRYGSAVADSYRKTDEALGKLLAAVEGDDFYVVITSDHGFESTPDKTKHIGTHHADGIYLVHGPGIEPGTGARTYIEDVTPTVLYLMGQPIGRDMEGKVMPDVAAAIGRVPQLIDSYEQAAREATDMPVDDKTWEQLRGLGYVDGAPPRAEQDKKAEPAPARPAPGAQKPAARPRPQAAPEGDVHPEDAPPPDEAPAH